MKKSAGWNWINKLGQAWVEKNPLAIPSLFADKFKYFETPFDKPINGKDNLIKLWQEVPETQKDIKFDFEIISEEENRYAAHFQVTFIRLKTGSKARLDGIFLIKLNNQGLCTLFKWWWNTEEKT